MSSTDFGNSPINGLGYAPEWVGTNIFLVCQPVTDQSAKLMPDELPYVEKVAERRRKTFSSGRATARLALANAGVPACALPRNEDGSVRWPQGVVGSLTHTNDWAIAAIAMPEMSEAAGVGIDLEQIQPLEAGVLRLIATELERQELKAAPNKHWLAVALFSLKESVYKCLRPSFGRFIEFHDVEILNLVSGRPSIRILSKELRVHCKGSQLELRMAITPEHVFTLAWLRQS